MRSLAVLVFAAAALLSLAWIPSAAAQASRPAATFSFAQAERNAVDLRQGMSAEEVHKLLGAGSSQGSLNVVFAATAPEKWYVNSCGM
jgi:hypothetical protein